jgi:hypothetical protein
LSFRTARGGFLIIVSTADSENGKKQTLSLCGFQGETREILERICCIFFPLRYNSDEDRFRILWIPGTLTPKNELAIEEEGD